MIIRFILAFMCRKEVKEMAVVYATLIIKGKKSIADVPERIRAQVMDVLDALEIPETTD
jgi:hypothetical protein